MHNLLAQYWFHHKATLHTGSGESPYGDTTGTEKKINCYIEQTETTIIGNSGDDKRTDTSVYCHLNTNVNKGDSITLHAPFSGTWVINDVVICDGGGVVPAPNHKKLVLKADYVEPHGDN